MTKITWLGHAAFRIETKDHVIFIDPWIDGNPVAPLKNADEIKKADLVLVTHDHYDHGFNDAVKICKNTNATFVGVFELAVSANEKGCKAEGGNIGGEITIGDVKIYFTHAIHSSNIAAPCGFVVSTPTVTIYDTGDTAFYSDMEYIARLYAIDIMILPIGSNFTMGVKEAAWAIEKVKPKIAIPCHYNTFPAIETDPEVLKQKVEKVSRVEILSVGAEKIVEV